MMKFKLYFDASKDPNLLVAFIEPTVEDFSLLCQKLNIKLHDLGAKGTLDRILYISRHELGLCNLNHLITEKIPLGKLVKIADSLNFREMITVNLGCLSLKGQMGGELIDHVRKAKTDLNDKIFRLLSHGSNEENLGISAPLYIDLQAYKALSLNDQSELNAYFQTAKPPQRTLLPSLDQKQTPFFSILKRGHIEELSTPQSSKSKSSENFATSSHQDIKTHDKMFFFNTESISDQHYLKTYFQHNKQARHIYMPAAGLKILKTLEDCSMDPELSTVTFYDYNRSLIEFKRALHLLWDGIDYPLFIKKYNEMNSLPDSPQEYSLHQKLWNKTVLAFGGAQRFSEAWQQLKKFKTKFIWIDVVTEPERFSDLVEDRPDTLIFLSNIYDYQETLLRGSLDNMYSYIRLLKSLKQKTNNPFLIGSNCFGGGDAFFIKSKEDIIPQLTDPFV